MTIWKLRLPQIKYPVVGRQSSAVANRLILISMNFLFLLPSAISSLYSFFTHSFGVRCSTVSVEASQRRRMFNVRRSAFLFLLPSAICLLSSFLCLSSSLSAHDVTDDNKKQFIDEQLRLADGLARRGHYRMAIDEYNKIIGKFPDDPLAADAVSQLAETYSLSGDIDKAVELFKLFLEKFPDAKTTPAVKTSYAVTLFKTGTAENRKEAVSILQTVKASKDTSDHLRTAAAYHLGKLLLESGDVEKAKAEFTALAAHPIESEDDMYSALARLELAVILDRENRKDKSEQLIRSLVDNKNTPPDILSAALGFLAATDFENKQYQKAADTFEQICLLFPGSAAGREAYLRHFECLLLAKQYSRAIKELDREIIKLGVDPQAEKLICLKGTAQMEQNQYDDALATFSRIVTSTTSSPEYYSKCATQYVQCLLNQALVPDAIRAAKDFMGNRRLSNEAKTAICDIVISALKAPYDKINFMKDVVNTARDTKERLALRMALAALHANLAQVDSSISLYNEIMSQCPDESRPECLLGMAKAYEIVKKDKEAMECYAKIRDSYPASPQCPEAMLRTAVLMLRSNPMSKEAEDILVRLEKEYRTSRDVHGNALFYLSYIEFTRGNSAKSAEGFRKIVSDNLCDARLSFSAKQYLLWSIASSGAFTQESDMLFSYLSANEDRMLAANPDMLLFLGSRFVEAGRHDDAIACYQAVAKNSSTDYRIKALTGLGMAYEGKNEVPKAIRFYREAEKIIPENKDVYSELLSRLGMALARKGDRNEAVLVFEKCIDLAASRNASARARLGLAEILAANPDDINRANRYAMSVFILSDDPDLTSRAMILSVELSLRQKNIEEAKATFDELKKRFPDLLKDEKVRKLSEKLR